MCHCGSTNGETAGALCKTSPPPWLGPVYGGLPSRPDYLPQHPPPRKKVSTIKTTAMIIAHSISVVLSLEPGRPVLKGS
jgi:hypothetical protein